MRDIRLLDAAFDPGSALSALDEASPEAGGLASFTGKVRTSGGVEALELSHYGPLTLPGMVELGSQAEARFELAGLVILHRTGTMVPGEPIVCVAAAAIHRRDAILAVDFCMDHLKSAAWFWKREKRGATWSWIEPRDADHADLARWKDGKIASL